MSKKLFVYFSPTGLSPTREALRSAGLPDVDLPYTPGEIAQSIKDTRSVLMQHCQDIGLMVHVHIRNEDGIDTLSGIKFLLLHKELEERGINVGVDHGLGLFYTSSVPNTNTPVAERAQHIIAAPTDMRPMGGTGLWGNFSFGRSRFNNSYPQMSEYVAELQSRQMIVENEIMIFDDNSEGRKKTQRMMKYLTQAIQDKILSQPVYINIVVGPSGLSYDFVEKQVKEIKVALLSATRSAGMKMAPLVFIGGAISPEESMQIAVNQDLDGIRFGAGECRADIKCSWADTSAHLAERLIAYAKVCNVQFANVVDLVNAFYPTRQTLSVREELSAAPKCEMSQARPA